MKKASSAAGSLAEPIVAADGIAALIAFCSAQNCARMTKFD